MTQVAMEATGSYWKPVWHVLVELDGVELSLCNAHHVKNLPGRESDVADAVWLAQLLDCGLLRGSFVPPTEIAELVDLTRYRTKLVQDRARETQRIQKLLEDANITLDSVVWDVLGKSSRRMLEVLLAGERDVEVMWSGKARKGNAALRFALCEAAWSAARTKDTYLSGQFQRFCRRFGKRGESKVIFAVAHTMLAIIWHVFHDEVDYQELGSDWFDRRADNDVQARRLVRQLERLGHRVTIEPAADHRPTDVAHRLNR